MTQLAHEMCTLGLCLQSRDAVSECLALGLEPKHFADPQHQLIFGAILEQEAKTGHIDPVTIGLKQPAIQRTVCDIMVDAPISQNARPHAEAVIVASWLRNLQPLLANAAKEAAAANPYEAIDKLREQLERISSEAIGPQHQQIGGRDIATIAMEQMQRIENEVIDVQLGKTLRTTTGIASLDRAMNGGWRPGSMYILGARTGIGKTTFALNALLAAAKQGRRSLYFTVEMLDGELFEKLVSNDGGVSGTKLDRRELSSSELDQLHKAAASVGAHQIVIDDKWSGRFDRLRLSVAKNMRKLKPDVVWVDYIQQATIPGYRGEARAQMLAEVSHGIKQMALRHRIAIVCLAQINRDGAKDDAGPELHHLKDCGAFEQDCDAALILHHQPAETRHDGKKSIQTPEKTLIKIRKQRRGGTICDIEVGRNMDLSRFFDQD